MVETETSDRRRNWKIVLPQKVIRETAELPTSVRLEAHDIITGLEEDPRPADSLPLRKNRNARRIAFYFGRHSTRNNHVALYRLIYEVFPATRTVKVLRIAYRDDLTYSGLDKW